MKKEYRVLSVQDAVREIKDGSRLVFSHGAVSPSYVVDEIVRQHERYHDLHMLHLIYMGKPSHLAPEMADHFRVRSMFMSGKDIRTAVAENRADYLPMHFSMLPSIFRQGGSYEPDWAIVQVTPPDAQGRHSVSLASDYGLPAARAAKHVLAIINDKLPFVGGDAFLTRDEIDIVVEHSELPFAMPAATSGEVEQTIARYCADFIPDGATLQAGIGALPDAVLSILTDRRDLGIHTELLTPGVVKLHKSGAITGRKKGIYDGKIICTFALGDQEMYDWMDHNDELEMYPVDIVNDPRIIGQNKNMISINSAVEIDLCGQVCAEKVGGKMYSGSGGQMDFIRGTRYSEGGKSIIALSSTALGGKISRIVPRLTEGVVTSLRNDVDYIITEYGVAQLFGRTENERAKALISIAHPDFREDLEKAWRSR